MNEPTKNIIRKKPNRAEMMNRILTDTDDNIVQFIELNSDYSTVLTLNLRLIRTLTKSTKWEIILQLERAIEEMKKLD